MSSAAAAVAAQEPTPAPDDQAVDAVDTEVAPAEEPEQQNLEQRKLEQADEPEPAEAASEPGPTDNAPATDTPATDGLVADADNAPAGNDPVPDDSADDDPANDDPSRPPRLPDEAELSMLDAEVRAELRALPRNLAEVVGRHLVAAGMLIDDDPELALRHARHARSRAARIAVVREAVGLTAYHAGEWAEALSELRAARRMSNGPGHVAVLADIERALGRPERALEVARDAQSQDLPRDEAIELKIVAAGARRDMGQLDAAVVALQIPELDPNRGEPWTARLCYAYADNLAAAGRTEEAIRWFLNAAQADDDGETDAAERAIELSHPEGIQPVLDELH